MIHIENKALRDMVSALESLLEGRLIDVRSFPEDTGVDFVVEIDTIQGKWIMPVEVKKQAYPRDIRQAVWGFDEFRRKNDLMKNIVPVFVAELISEGAREMLKAHNIGYYELSGTFFIRHNHMLIDIQRPRKRTTKAGVVDLFSGARERVVHALLQSHGMWFSGEELSELSGTSAYTVSGVLRELELREWIVKSREGGRSQRRRLTHPGDLLDAWADATRRRKKHKIHGYLFAADVVDCIKKIQRKAGGFDEDITWAVTGALAANQASPLLTGVNVAEIIVPLDKAELFTRSAGIKYAEKGYNIIVHEWAGAGLQFIKTENDFPVASNFIQYLSLLDGKGRNAELAEQFRRDILEI